MAQEEIPDNINFPPFETERFNPPGRIFVAGTTGLTYIRFSQYINTILNVIDSDKDNGLNVPSYTHVDYRLWLLNLFKNVTDKEEIREYLGSNPPRNIDNPELDNNTKKAFKKFYQDNKVKIEKIKAELTIDKVVKEREFEAERYKEIAEEKRKRAGMAKEADDISKEDDEDDEDDEGISKEDDEDDEGMAKEDEGIENSHSRSDKPDPDRNPLRLRQTKKKGRKRIKQKRKGKIFIHCKKDENNRFDCENPGKISIDKGRQYLTIDNETKTDTDNISIIIKNKNKQFKKITDKKWHQTIILYKQNYD